MKLQTLIHKKIHLKQKNSGKERKSDKFENMLQRKKL